MYVYIYINMYMYIYYITNNMHIGVTSHTWQSLNGKLKLSDILLMSIDKGCSNVHFHCRGGLLESTPKIQTMKEEHKRII